MGRIRLLVTGGRFFSDVEGPKHAVDNCEECRSRPVFVARRQREFVWDCLHLVHEGRVAEYPDVFGVELLIHGGAAGVDTSAKIWAQDHDVPQIEYFVNTAAWARHGRHAGNNRNHRMLLDQHPGLVLVLPGETGTADCAAQARAMGIAVWEPKLPTGAW